jgi:hypothetical protein
MEETLTHSIAGKTTNYHEVIAIVDECKSDLCHTL